MIKILTIISHLFNLFPKKELNKEGGGGMPGLLQAAPETRESFLDNEGQRIDIIENRGPIENIVQERINNALKQEFKKEKDFQSFMKINEKEIGIIKNFIKEKVS